jgi:hypothetical protein
VEGECEWSCHDDPAAIGADLAAHTRASLGALTGAAAAAGVRHAAVSEWSLATFHDSSAGCLDAAVLDAVYAAQASEMTAAGVASFFWGWKMPSGGVHQRFWSMDHFQRHVHSPRMSLAAALVGKVGPGSCCVARHPSNLNPRFSSADLTKERMSGQG